MTDLLALSFVLDRPVWLLALLLVPVFILLTRRVVRGPLRAYDLTALTARALVLLALSLSLAGPRIELEDESRSVAFLLDVSESIPAEALDNAKEFIAQSAPMRGEDDDVAFLVFADGAAVEAPFNRISSVSRRDSVPVNPDHIASVLSEGESDVDGALQLSRAVFPPGGSRRIVLLTDGNQTRGDALSVARELIADGVQLQVVPIRYERTREVLVQKLVVPPSAPRGDPVPVRAVISSTHSGVPARIRFLVDGEEVLARDETLEAGRNVFEVGQAFGDSGFHRMEVVVEPQSGSDGNPANNRGLAATHVAGGSRVLVATREDPSPLADALRGELEATVDVTGPEGLPSDPGGYVPYDAIVIENIPSYALTRVQRRVLATAVRELGAGLVCIGGREAYGPGGYGGTELEEVLPLSSEVKNKRVLPSGALAVILHTCEFAGGNTAARDITKAAIMALSARDEIGVIQFSWSAADEWLIKLQPVGTRDRHLAAMDTADPGDMPNFDSAHRLALPALQKSTAAVKHMVVISDGDATPPSPALVQKFIKARITISTVCVDPHDPNGPGVMARLSQATGGRHYDVTSNNLGSLPAIFIKEAVTVRRSAWKEEPFRLRLTGTHPSVGGFETNDFPALRGYTVTTAKPNVEQIAVGPDGDPLLAAWRHGLGEVIAFTSDASALWAQDWVTWGGYSRFWPQTVRSVLRALERPGIHMSTETEGGRTHVVVDALRPDGGYLNGLSMRGAVLGPDGGSGDFVVEQTGPGRYEGSFPATRVGTYVATLAYREPDAAPDSAPLQVAAGVCVAYSAEHLAQRSNERFFALLEAEGAEILDLDALERASVSDPGAPTPAELPWTGATEKTSEPVELWPWLAALAALLLVLDVAVRRLRIVMPAFARKKQEPKTASASVGPTVVASGQRASGPPPGDPDATPRADAPATGKPGTSASPSPDGASGSGLLGAKRRAQKREKWEENQ